MNRGLSFAIASLQALIIIASVVGLIVAPLTLSWFIEGDGSVEWIVALQVAGFAFLLACGVPLQITQGELVGIAFDTFTLSALPLGLTLLMALMAIRIGYRLSAASSLWPAWIGGSASFGGISYGLSLIIATESVSLGEWDALFIPALFFGGLLFIASISGTRFELFEGANGPEAKERVWIREQLRNLHGKLHWSLATVLSPAIRIGTSVIAMLILASSLLISLALGFGWVEVLRLYQSLGLSLLGGVMLTIGQLAILPNLIVFGAGWISGAGFMIGSGSLVSPLASQLGPLPALPIFAALPTGGFDRGILFALLPIATALIATVIVRRRADQMRWEYATRWGAALALSFMSALVAAIVAFAMALLASGSIGPGRFAVFGVDGRVFAAVVFLEVLIPVFLASLVVVRPYNSADERK
ncbi:MAG: DUF6350 family protein [Aquiluna sp.]